MCSSDLYHLKIGDWINVPLAHGEGRFIIPNELLRQMIDNDQTIFRYCDNDGIINDEFPTNPNGSLYNLAAVCNPAGNVMAIMPHPERTENGDAIFSSMKEFIEKGNPVTDHTLSFERSHYKVSDYNPNPISVVWPVDMIITDHESSPVGYALDHLGFDISIS